MSELRHRIVRWVATEVMPHEQGVRAWLRRSHVPADDIDDLIQEAYCAIAELDDVDAIERPDAYFFQTVRNLLNAQLRRARIVRFDTLSEADGAQLRADQPTPEETAAARRELGRVQRLIAQLPDRCRRVFELRKIHGVPQREIARMLGISEGTVENDAVKGLKLILKAVREETVGEQSERRSDERSRNRR